MNACMKDGSANGSTTGQQHEWQHNWTAARMAARQTAVRTATRTVARRTPARPLARCGGTTDASVNAGMMDTGTNELRTSQTTNMLTSTMNTLTLLPNTTTNEPTPPRPLMSQTMNMPTPATSNANATMNGPTNALTPSVNNITNTDVLPFDHCHQRRCCSGAGGLAALMNHRDHNQVQICTQLPHNNILSRWVQCNG